MLITPHVTAGAVIGITFQDPYLVFPTAVASHFVLDLIPHWDPDPARLKRALGFLTLDTIAALLVLLWAISEHHSDRRAIFWGAAGAILPDIIENAHFQLRKKKIPYFSAFHLKVHVKRPGVLIGIATQVVFLIVALWLIGLGS
jgi:hypothetical protein